MPSASPQVGCAVWSALACHGLKHAGRASWALPIQAVPLSLTAAAPCCLPAVRRNHRDLHQLKRLLLEGGKEKAASDKSSKVAPGQQGADIPLASDIAPWQVRRCLPLLAVGLPAG